MQNIINYFTVRDKPEKEFFSYKQWVAGSQRGKERCIKMQLKNESWNLKVVKNLISMLKWFIVASSKRCAL